jgi:hypothetical protein
VAAGESKFYQFCIYSPYKAVPVARPEHMNLIGFG